MNLDICTSFIEKLNKIFDSRIQYHTDVVQKHTDKILKLNKKRLIAIKEAVDEMNKLDMNYSPHNNEKSIDAENNLFKTLHSSEDVLDSGLDDQDMIWDRIRQSQLKNEHEIKSKNAIPVTVDNNEPIVSDLNNEPIVSDLNNEPIVTVDNNEPIVSDLNNTPVDNTSDELTPPTLNALFKVNPTTRKHVIKKIFNEAIDSITKLSDIDNKYKDNFDVEVQKEADRLLDVYLQTH